MGVKSWPLFAKCTKEIRRTIPPLFSRSVRKLLSVAGRRQISSTLGRNSQGEPKMSNDEDAGTSLVEGKRPLGPWSQPPVHKNKPELRLINSLTRKKELFVPESGNRVSFYICGPTVYDASHLGHARSYICFDIVRRVLQSYFGYDVQYVMNITDIDDKIINRARQRHLVATYLGQEIGVRQTIDDIQAALKPFNTLKIQNETVEEKKKAALSLVQKTDVAVAQLEKLLMEKAGDPEINEAKNAALDAAKDIIGVWLDAQQGSAVRDLEIFTRHARHFENQFHEDMGSLGVMPPDVLTRVSEYIPEIVEFIRGIIQKGFAYEMNGSVYFDTVAFDKEKIHHYAKLVPEAFGDENALKEGEGELSISAARLQEKRNQSDFALWKASKAGEPSWESEWGPGRPGWHIECSVMATSICGKTLDIHAGGFDLKFPHHDNEIAQTEAYYGEKQWVNYFLHAGTLRIAGLKMAKSLKNFITIREALREYTARQMRILFLLHNWWDVLDYSSSTMEAAFQFEKMTNEFFLLVKHLERTHFNNDDQSFQKFQAAEMELNETWHEAKSAIHTAMCDSIDTRTVMDTIRDLISKSNVYIQKKDEGKTIPNVVLLRNIAAMITRLLRVFGIAGESVEIGFADADQLSGGNKEELLMPYLNAMVAFREKVRTVAREHKVVDILNECDRLRDETLPKLGVRLEDKQGHTIVKLVSPEELIREMEQKKIIEDQKRKEQELKKAEKEAKEAAKRIPPGEMFRKDVDKYSKFDEKGIPTHDTKGEEISKKQRKKLEKAYEVQEKKYNDAMGKEAAQVVNGSAA